MLHRILEDILAHKRREVAAAKARRPMGKVLPALAPPRGGREGRGEPGEGRERREERPRQPKGRDL